MKTMNSNRNRHSAMLWRCVSALRRVFRLYRDITEVRVQVFFSDDSEPGYTYEDKLE